MNKPILHTFPSDIVQHSAAQFIARLISEQIEKNMVPYHLRYSATKPHGAHTKAQQRSKPILLLLSGGSAIGMYKEMFEILKNKNAQLTQCTVSLFDERFVTKGSTDSNEQQLKEAGVLSLCEKLGAKWLPYLSENQTDGQSSAKKISNSFSLLLSTHTLIILAGLGDDGHTAGILPVKPYSPNKQKLFNSQEIVTYYEVDKNDSDNPFRQRLTSTQVLIEKADQVILYVTGEKKHSALEKFIENNAPIYQCPILTLHKSKNLPIVLTDIDLARHE